MSETRTAKKGVGIGGMGKTIVMGVLERATDDTTGEVRAMTIPNNSTRTIQSIVREHVAPGARLMTDSASAYVGMDEYDHQSLNTTPRSSRAAQSTATRLRASGAFSSASTTARTTG